MFYLCGPLCTDLCPLSPPLLTLLAGPLGVIVSLRLLFCALCVLWYHLWGPQRPPCDDHCTWWAPRPLPSTKSFAISASSRCYCSKDTTPLQAIGEWGLSLPVRVSLDLKGCSLCRTNQRIFRLYFPRSLFCLTCLLCVQHCQESLVNINPCHPSNRPLSSPPKRPERLAVPLKATSKVAELRSEFRLSALGTRL